MSKWITVLGILTIPIVVLVYYLLIETTILWMFPNLTRTDAMYISIMLITLVVTGVGMFLSSREVS